MDDLHLEENIGGLKVDDRTTILVEVLAYDPAQHNHIMRSAIYGQIFALHGKLREDVSIFLLIGAKVVNTSPNRLEIDQNTAVCPRPPIKLTDVPKVIEFCAGLGCLGVGLKHAGFEVVLVNDISKPMLDLSKRIHHSTTLIGDVCQDTTIAEVCQAVPYSCTVAAGVSCQPYSRLGDKRARLDPRARTLPSVLRASLLMRHAVIILECVDEAFSCEWVQTILKAFHQLTGYYVHQDVEQLSNLWPAKRNRWWCVLSHPMLGKITWNHLPKVVPTPIISHVIDNFLQCMDEELKQIELDTYELRHFDNHGYHNNLVPLHGKMATSLHSIGNQFTGCPCHCRSHPFTNERIQKGGLHSLLIRINGETKIAGESFPRHRYIHPCELALLNGMFPDMHWGDNLKLALAGLGQLASPLQSCWIGSHVIQHLHEKGFLDQKLGSPQEILSSLMAELLRRRDQCFGCPKQANAKVFQAMVQQGKFEMPHWKTVLGPIDTKPIEKEEVCPIESTEPTKRTLPIPICPSTGYDKCNRNSDDPSPKEASRPLTLSQGFGGGLTETEFHAALTNGSTLMQDQWMSPSGGVMGFAAKPPPLKVDRGRKQSDPSEVVRTETVVKAMPDHNCTAKVIKPVLSPPLEKIDETVTTTSSGPPQEVASVEKIQIVLMPATDNCAFDVSVTKDTTAGQLTQAEAELGNGHHPIFPCNWVGATLPLYEPLEHEQVVILHEGSSICNHGCPAKSDNSTPPQISLPCDRVQALFQQAGWVAMDEMTFYLQQICPTNGIVIDPICHHKGEISTEEQKDWYQAILTKVPHNKFVISAILQDAHWIPIIIQADPKEIIVGTTFDLGTQQDFQDIVDGLSQSSAFPDLGLTVNRHPMTSVFSGDCGFQSVSWIQNYITGKFDLGMQPKEAERYRRMFSAHLYQHKLAQQTIHTLPIGGMMQESEVNTKLTTLLIDHGVFPERVRARVEAIQSKLSQTVLSGIMQSPKPWQDLKATANQQTPVLKLVMTDELAKQIASRSKDTTSIGTRKQKNHRAPKEKTQIQVHASALSIPPGVFKQEDGALVSQLGQDEVGPNARGVVLLDSGDAEAILKLTRPVSQHGLAIIVIPSPGQSVDPQTSIRFPVMCIKTEEPMIINGSIYQLGQQEILRHEPVHKLAVDVREASVVRCLVYKDQANALWTSLHQQPVKQVFATTPELTKQNQGESVVMDVWDRQWYTKRFERTKYDQADIFAFSMRIAATEVDSLLSQSGSRGIYFEPRSTCGRMPSTEYHVTWLNQTSHTEAKIAQQTSPQTTTLVRHGDRYGLRSDSMNAQEIHEKHRPDTPMLLGNTKQLYSLGPMPFSTTREGVGKLLKAWKWDARALQPRGRALDGTGINWSIQATEDPSHWIFTLQHGDVLITKAQVEKSSVPPDACGIIASRKTIDQFKQSLGEDPWQKNDPWSGYKPVVANPKEITRAVPSNGMSSAQIAAVEANIEKRLIATLSTKSEDVTMEGSMQEVVQKVTQLENQLQQVVHHQQQVDNRLNGMQSQMDQQAVQFASAVETQMTAQMDRIESLLAKRSRME